MSINKNEDFSARDFRDALSSFATGVTIVTASDPDGEPIGMTASSFNSVSTDPPLVLWSVTKAAYSAPSFKAAKNFAIHVLATDQTDLSNKFAKSGTDKFGDVNFHRDANAVPIIEGTAARFDCTTWEVYEGGDHWIIVGLVNSIESEKREGLVFGGGCYAMATPLTTLNEEQQPDRSFASPIDDMLFYHLSRAYHQMGTRFHDAVIESGLSVAEWRVSASLYGQVTRTFQDLAARTFLDPKSLNDIVSAMEEDGMCRISRQNSEQAATGTQKGHDRVAHLFDLARDQEKSALSNLKHTEAETLKAALKQLISDTNSD